MPAMARRISGVAGALAVAAIALAGCGGGAAAAGGTNTTSSTTTAPTTTSTSTTTTTSTSTTTTSTTVPAVAACQTNDLDVQTIISTCAAGTDYLEVVVGAKGGTRCEVDGYPNADLYGMSEGVEATLPEVPVKDKVTGDRPLGLAPMPIVIGPNTGDTAAFYLGVAQVAAAGEACQKADGIEFQAPGSAIWSGEVSFATASTGPGAMGNSITACDPSISVSVFQPSSLPDVSG
jgi:hypothetical protein